MTKVNSQKYSKALLEVAQEKGQLEAVLAEVSEMIQLFNEIQQGYLLLVGIVDGDDQEIVGKMAAKVHDLRIFEDENGKMNLSIEQIGGQVLSISQFTLYANCKKGRRPSFD